MKERYLQLCKKYHDSGLTEAELTELRSLKEELCVGSMSARNLGDEYSVFDIATLFD